MASSTSRLTQEAAIPIAKLVPVGVAAEKAFDDLVACSGISSYHRGFIHAKRTIWEDPSFRNSDDGSGTGSPVSQGSKTRVELWAGHFSIASDHVFQIGPAGLRVERGTFKFREDNRGLDIIVLRPGRTSTDVKLVHALVQYHPASDVLMLVSMSDT